MSKIVALLGKVVAFDRAEGLVPLDPRERACHLLDQALPVFRRFDEPRLAHADAERFRQRRT